MCNRQVVRKAFTTVELLVVVAIIAVLAALLLPAVQLMRERARQTTCLNNLKNIGLAFTQHAGAWQGMLPNAGGYDVTNTPQNWDLQRCQTSSGVPVPTKQQDWGWAYQILPYIQKQPFYDGPAGEAASLKVALYFCPSRRKPVATSGQGCGLPADLRGAIDYAGNGGYRNKISGVWYPPAPSVAHPISTNSFAFPIAGSQTNADGAVILGKRTGPSPSNLNNTGAVQSEFLSLGTGDFPDGASATILVGERLFDYRSTSGDISDEDNGYVAGYTWDTIRWGYVTPASDVDYTRQQPAASLAENIDNTAFGSSHPLICHFVFCDGSTKKISYTIDLATFRALCSRNDGNAPPVPGQQ